MEEKEIIQEMSKISHLSEGDVKKLLELVSKPSLKNTHCNFENEVGVGSSDKPTKHSS